MSKTIALSLALAASLGLAACGDNTTSENVSTAVDNTVVTTENAAADAMNMAENATDAATNAVGNVM
ncbi:MAG TPA: circumsporozoite protein [Rhizorhapis sp.]